MTAQSDKQLAALAELGRSAFAETDLEALLDRAVQMAAEHLGMEWIEVLELSADGYSLRRRAGTGGTDAVDIEAGPGTLSGYAAHRAEPVVVEDLANDPRFTGWPHGSASGLSLAIQRNGEPYGVLSAYSRQRRTFQSSEILFAQALAAILSVAVRQRETERKAQEQTSFLQLQQVVAAAANEARSVEEAVQAALDLVCGYTGWPVGHVFMVADVTPNELVPTGIWHVSDRRRYAAFRTRSESLQFGVGHGMTGRALANAKPIWLPDLTAEPGFARRVVATEAGLRSGCFIPVWAGEQVVAVLEFFSDERTTSNPQLIELLMYVGTQLGRVFERVRATQALQRLQGRLQLQASALQAAANGIVITNSQGLVEWVNPAFTALTGYTAEEAIGQNPRVLKSGQHDAAFYRQMWQTIQSGQVWRGEVTNKRKDGTLYTEDMTITPVRDAADGVSHFIAIKQDVSARKQAELALRQSEERFRSLIENGSDVITLVDVMGTILYESPSLRNVLGYAPEELVGTNAFDLVHPDDQRRVMEIFSNHLQTRGPSFPVAFRYRHKDGSWRHLEAVGNNLLHDPSVNAAVINSRDVTDSKHLEAQLRQSQKMEAVGRLAGGVAHDFNNLLTAILGYCGLTLQDLNEQSGAYQRVTEIERTAHRAAGLTRQLLAFSRKQVLQPVALDLNAVVREVEQMLHRLIGEDIQLRTACTENLGCVLADPGQIEQVIMNLAVNARDAMPRGGVLTLETTNYVHGTTAADGTPEMPAGEYVMLAITDTGTGMPPEVKAHLFEPFFTTKQQGKGTGLGLATCFGIVRQSNGFINVYSEPGHGTTFKIYLPRIAGAAKVNRVHDESSSMPGGQETLLLVEDESVVRGLAATVLRDLGYTVLPAANGVEALEIAARETGRPFHLLLTDVVMPQLGGRDLADQLRQKHPGLKVLFTSGYTEDTIVHHGVLSEGLAFLPKPYTPSMLARKVREILDASVERSTEKSS